MLTLRTTQAYLYYCNRWQCNICFTIAIETVTVHPSDIKHLVKNNPVEETESDNNAYCSEFPFTQYGVLTVTFTYM